MGIYYLDTEFADTGTEIKLISIGIASSDGRSYYAQDASFDLTHASLWLQEYVISHLKEDAYKSREQIKRDILAFMDSEKYGKPDLRGWCCGYDFVVFCQLFGTMMDLPAGFPHYMRDMQSLLDDLGISDEELPPQEEGLHHALADALYLKKIWGYLLSPLYQKREGAAQE